MTEPDEIVSSTNPRLQPKPPLIGRVLVGLLCGAAALMVLGLVGLTVADTMGRYFQNSPMRGQTERIEFFLTAVVTVALPAACIILCFNGSAWRTGRFGRAEVGSSILLVVLLVVLMAALAYVTYMAGAQSSELNEMSSQLQLPRAYQYWAMSTGAFLAAIGGAAGGLAGFATKRWRAA